MKISVKFHHFQFFLIISQRRHALTPVSEGSPSRALTCIPGCTPLSTELGSTFSPQWQHHCYAPDVVHYSRTFTSPVNTNQYEGFRTKVEPVGCENDLGVNFNAELKYVNDICRNEGQRRGLIGRSFTYIDEKMYLVFYQSLLRPILEYCSTVWNIC